MSVKPILLDMESMMDVIAMYKCKFCEYTSENQLEVKNHINVHLMPAENLPQLHVRLINMYGTICQRSYCFSFLKHFILLEIDLVHVYFLQYLLLCI